MYEKTNFNHNFYEFLKRGNELENELKELLEELEPCTVIQSASIYEGSFSDWDLKVNFKDGSKSITIELKEDNRAMQTKNVAIEFGRVVKGNWKDTCISVTKADYWCQYFNHTFYFVEIETLRNLIKNGLYTKIVEGGDGERSRMYIIPLKTFLQHAHPIKK